MSDHSTGSSSSHRPSSRRVGHQPIAVVGVSALFPGSSDARGFWHDILAGRDLLSDVPPSHWLIEDYYDPDPSAEDKTYARRGGFLPKVDFDALGWGIPPSIIPATDTAQLLALMVAEQVLADAWGTRFRDMDKDRMSCILGVTSAQELLSTMTSRLQRPVWIKALREAGLPESEVQRIAQNIADHYTPWQEATFPGLLGNVVAGRIANRLDLGGTNCVTDAACASTLSALHMAVNELYLGDSDVVIAGGVDTMNEIFMYMCFSKTPALSPTGDCRPFSDQADGTMLGEGLAMVALKRLEDAEADGDRIYAVIEAVGSSSDGRSKSVYAPVSEGQAKAIRRAYQRAGFSPATVELIEAHGTGTKAGDVAEFAGLQAVFDEAGRPDRQWCALGSVKSQIGHTKAAAGAAGLFKAVMAVHHKVLPPTIKVDRPNPRLNLEASPFHLATRARPWVRGTDHPRRAGVSSFGFGGSNFHVAVQEYVGPHRAGRLRTWDHELVVLTAPSAEALADKARALADGAQDLQWTAWSTAHESLDGPHRLAIVASDIEALRAALRRSIDRIGRGEPFHTPDGIHYGTGKIEGGTGPEAVAFLFPGQGSQYLDMGAAVTMNLDAAADAWSVAADVGLGDRGLHTVVFPPTAFDADTLAAQEARLTATEWAQPAIGATSLAMLAVVRSLGLEARHLAGHSYGEVTALHAAGSFSAADMLRIARRRGELMAEASETPGAMTAVAADLADVRAALAEAGLLEADAGGPVIANHNHPTQVVLSGTTEAIERAEAALTARAMTCRRLSVSTGFHSPLVSPCAEPFRSFLDTIELAAPKATVWCNATGTPYPSDPDEVRTTLARAVAEPVRFVDMIEAMYAAGVRSFVEVGPGNVLTRLTRRILGERPHVAVDLDRRGRDGMASLLDGVARLVVAGHDVDLRGLWAGYKAPRDPESLPRP
ncbi:MAG: acyltransferase domain-containing protein, partial [Deltaproteobacteria bacterium]